MTEISTPSRSDSVVFILGAGASAAYMMPTMPQFMSYARRRLFDTYRDGDHVATERSRLERLLTFHSECLASAWAFNRNWDNIEELYTQADLCRIAEIPNRDEAEVLCKDIAWAIWDVYRCDRSEGNKFGDVLGRAAESSLSPVVITTNYDLVAERALSMHEGKAVRGFYYPGFRNPKESGRLLNWIGDDEGAVKKELDLATQRHLVPVIKIHGSVNWFKFGNSEVRAFYEYGLNPASKDGRKFNEDVLPFNPFITETISLAKVADVVSEDVTPVIIPPMLGKSADLQVVTHQWREAIEVLSKAREIWIVGYSFPDTDAFMTRLLTEGMQSNRDLDFVAIVNTAPLATFEPRLRQIFNSTFIDTRVQYYQGTADRMFGQLHARSWGKGKQYIDNNPIIRADLMN